MNYLKTELNTERKQPKFNFLNLPNLKLKYDPAKKLAQREEEIQLLRRENSELKEKIKEYSGSKMYEKQIENLTNKVQDCNFYIEHSKKMEGLNEILFKKVDELEQAVLRERQKNLDKLKLEKEQELEHIKKQFILFIQNKHDADKKETKKDLNHKLNLLHLQECIREIEFATKYIEILIKENSKLRSKIIELKTSLKMHEEISNCMMEKNARYQKQVHLLSKELNNKDDITNKATISKTNSINTTHIPTLEKTMNATTSVNSNAFAYIQTSPNIKKFNVTLGNSSFRNIVINKHSGMNTRNNSISNNFNNELNINYKEKYEFVQGKLNLIEKRYSNFFELIDSSIDSIIKNSNIKYKDAVIDLEKFKLLDFDEISDKEKLLILSIIIQYIFPLIQGDIKVRQRISRKLSLVKSRFSFDNKGKHRYIHDSNTTNSSIPDAFNVNFSYSSKKNKNNSICLDSQKKSKIILENNNIEANWFSLFGAEDIKF